MKVLISPGYGAGWSTWNNPELATDPRVISAFERGVSEEEMRQLCKDIGLTDSYGDIYMGGFYQLEIVEVPAGALFAVQEYDGHEYIEIAEEGVDGWMRAV